MTFPIGRGQVTGVIESIERKTVNDKPIAEVRIQGFGIKITAWGDMTQQVPPEGSVATIEGNMKTRQYEVDGQARRSTEITASSITVLLAKGGSAAAASDDSDGDLPF